MLVVDDSALMRKLIPQMLQRDPSIEVVGTAMDGAIGLKKLEELHPHVVTLDLEMPRMDGIEMLRQITRKHRVPVIMVSAQRSAAPITLKALSLGAFDFVTKPPGSGFGRIEQIAAELALKIKVAAAAGAPKMIITVPPTKQKGSAAYSAHAAMAVADRGDRSFHRRAKRAAVSCFRSFPRIFRACFLVVQHMPEGFTEMFARRLNESSAIEVKEARSGDLLLAGRALICPGQSPHESAAHGAREHGDTGGSAPRERPSPVGRRAISFRGAGIRQQAIGVLMTGMGEDGAAGMGAIQAAGGFTIAQSPETCVVDSMPRAAIERGFAGRVVSLSSLASYLAGEVRRGTAAERARQISDSATEILANESGLRRRSP